jgi:hypothetical protein
MKHRTLPANWIDEPCPIVAIDRRSHPDRRAVWRGGRRDDDWINRPPGAIDRIGRGERSILGWRRRPYSRQI